MNLYIIPKKRSIPLADNKQSAEIIGEVIINIEINGQVHRGVTVEVIKDLCIDIIIGRDRLRKHRRVIFNFDGPGEDLVIGAVPEQSSADAPDQTADSSTQFSTNPSNNSTTKSLPPNFGTVNIPPPPLFTNLSNNMRPVATRSRRQSPANLRYIKAEVAKLRQAGIIQPSVSPWRAQAFVTQEDGTHKRRMVIDYSETINLYTELDAYPMPNVLKMVQDVSKY